MIAQLEQPIVFMPHLLIFCQYRNEKNPLIIWICKLSKLADKINTLDKTYPLPGGDKQLNPEQRPGKRLLFPIGKSNIDFHYFRVAAKP